MSDEINERLAEALTAAIDSDALLTIESEHDPACPGGGDYCSSHCPVPVQVVVEPDALVERVAASLRPTVDALLAEARREVAERVKAVLAEGPDTWTPYESRDCTRERDNGRRLEILRESGLHFAYRSNA